MWRMERNGVVLYANCRVREILLQLIRMEETGMKVEIKEAEEKGMCYDDVKVGQAFVVGKKPRAVYIKIYIEYLGYIKLLRFSIRAGDVELVKRHRDIWQGFEIGQVRIVNIESITARLQGE